MRIRGVCSIYVGHGLCVYVGHNLCVYVQFVVYT